MAPKRGGSSFSASRCREPGVSRFSAAIGGGRSPLVGPRPEPSLAYDKGKQLAVKHWLRQVPAEGELEVRTRRCCSPSLAFYSPFPFPSPVLGEAS